MATAEAPRNDGWAKRRQRVASHIERTALEMIAAEGAESVTVGQIASAAGISMRTFFRYFSTRDEVMAALPQRLVEELCLLVAARPDSESVLEAFMGAMHDARDEPVDEDVVLLWGKARRHWPMDAPGGIMIASYKKAIADRIGAPLEDLRVEVMATAIGSVMWTAFLRWLASDGARPLMTIMEESFTMLVELNEHAGPPARRDRAKVATLARGKVGRA